MKPITNKVTASDIAKALKHQAYEVAQYLVPGGKRIGNEYRAGGVEGGKGSSLHIYVEGDKQGLWKEHNGGEEKYQDLLELWKAARNISTSHAMQQAKAYLNLEDTWEKDYTKKVYSKPEPLQKGDLSPNSLVRKYLNSRLIPDSIIDIYQIKERKSTKTGEWQVVFPYFKNRVHVRSKMRCINEKKFTSSPNTMDCLFGWQAPNPSTENIHDFSRNSVVICEGEIDAMTYHYYGYKALSIPMGASNLNWLEHEFKDLAWFTNIYISMDMDEAGQKCAKQIAKRLADYKPRIVELPYKDINECLAKGMCKQDIIDCFNEAHYDLPIKIEPASSEWFIQSSIEAIHPVNDKQPGYGMGFNKTDSDIWFRQGEMSIWSGINGHGKSTFLNQIILNQLSKGAKACIASLEIPICKLLPRLIRQGSGMHEPSKEYIKYILEWTNNKLWIYNHLGIQSIDELLLVFDQMYSMFGCEVFVIDSLMLLDVDEESLTSQKEIVRKITQFVQARDCHLHLVAHPRKLVSEFQKPNKMDVAGSGHIVNMTDNMFLVFRNKIKEIALLKLEKNKPLTKLEEEAIIQCDTLLTCSKQRYGEVEKQYSFYYDVKNLRYREFESEPVKAIINYSKTWYE